MKKIWLGGLFGLLLTIVVASIPTPHVSAACPPDNNTNTALLEVVVQPQPNTLGLSITASRIGRMYDCPTEYTNFSFGTTQNNAYAYSTTVGGQYSEAGSIYGCTSDPVSTYNITVRDSSGNIVGTGSADCLYAGSHRSNTTTIRISTPTQQQGTLSGTVNVTDPGTNRTTHPTGGAVIVLTNEANSSLTYRYTFPVQNGDASRATDGRYTIAGITPGTYRMTVDGQYPGSVGAVSNVTTSFSYSRTGIVIRAGANSLDVTSTGSRPTDNTAGNTSAPATCESLGGWAWFLCPVVKLLDSGVNMLVNAIDSMLTVNQLYGQTDGELYKVWAAVRNISLLLLIPAMLLMVIGTALDFGPFDPYTVKKSLPRMVAATIFISLSWWICTALIDLSDLVGGGIMNLITSVAGVGSGALSLGDLLGVSDSTLIFSSLLATGVVAGVVGALSLGIVLSYALVAFIGLLMGYLALVFRLLLILGFLVFSPIFVLSWIFPGNDRIWKIGKDGFIGLLIVYPVIKALLGIARVAAFIVSRM